VLQRLVPLQLELQQLELEQAQERLLVQAQVLAQERLLQLELQEQRLHQRRCSTP
jgi:hypothetical protein